MTVTCPLSKIVVTLSGVEGSSIFPTLVGQVLGLTQLDGLKIKSVIGSGVEARGKILESRYKWQVREDFM